MNMLVFALNASAAFGKKVASHLQVALARHQESDFEDGEHKTRSLEEVCGHDVFIIHTLYAEPGQSSNDKICRLLFFAGALRDAGAGRITAIIPYFAYARQDRTSEPCDPVTMKYMARMLEGAGVDRVVSMDIHNLAAYQNAFRIPVENLAAQEVFAAWFGGRTGGAAVTVVAPDAGGIKRAQAFRDSLAALLQQSVGIAYMEKQRSAGKVSGGLLAGDVRGCSAIIVDDIISTGATVNRALAALEAQGAGSIFVAATHGIFAGSAADLLECQSLERMLITDTIPSFRLQAAPGRTKLVELSVAALFADAISRIHADGTYLPRSRLPSI